MAGGQRRIRGRYEMLRRVDRGEDQPGRTWLVRDEQTGLLRALKQLSYRGRPDADRIGEELNLRRVVEDPGLPELHDLFLLKIDGQQQWFVIRDWADGRSLEQVLVEDGALNPDHVRWIGTQLLDRLAALHAQGLVHGDVHPHNIIFSDEGASVTLVDHGALKAAARQGLSGGWGFAVDPQTVAPETEMGRPSHRSDVYSMGATLVQALTGRPLGDFDRDELAEQLVKQFGATPGLAQVLLKLTEPLSDGRFEDKEETRRALMHGLGDEGEGHWWNRDFRLDPDPAAQRRAKASAMLWLALVAVPFWGVALLVLPPLGQLTAGVLELARCGLALLVLLVGGGLLTWSAPWLLDPLKRSFGANREGVFAIEDGRHLHMPWKWMTGFRRRGPLLMVEGHWAGAGLGAGGASSLAVGAAYEVSLEQLEHILSERMLPEEEREEPPPVEEGPTPIRILGGLPLPVQAALVTSAALVPCFVVLAFLWSLGNLGAETESEDPTLALIGEKGEIQTTSTGGEQGAEEVVWARQCPEGMQPTAVVAHGAELMACEDLGGVMALVPGTTTRSPFLADRLEVSVLQYQACELAEGCTATPQDAGCNAAAASRERHPVNCVTKEQAEAFCSWQHKRLCTGSEFERLGGGPSGLSHPWGEQAATCDLAVVAGPSAGCGKGGTWPAGARPRGARPVGCLDVVGNVAEWTSEGLRGGSWATPAAEAQLSSGGTGAGPTSGFRCCRDL